MKGDTIDLFMWGFQQHMQHSFEFTAGSMFEKIDKKLEPKITLLGVLTDGRTDRHPICLEPEDCGFQVQHFSGLKKLAGELEQVDQDGKMFHTHPIAQENHTRRITTKSYIEGIKKILIREDVYERDDYFVAAPTYIDGFLVFTILSLNSEALRSHYSLTKGKMVRFTIYRSFIESAVSILLNECTNALKDPNNGVGAIERRTEELLREAGRQLMYTVSWAGKNFDGLHGLYDACNEIASMKYEGGIGIGSIIIAPADHKNIKLTLQLEHPIKMRDFRMVRKFLEISDDSSAIICDSSLIYGLGELRGKYNPKEENIFVINFTSHFKWEILHDNNPLMEVSYRQPNLPAEKLNREKFYSDFPRVFKGILKTQVDDLWDIAMEAIKQKHGTMLVISDNTAAEAERLGKQSFPLKPSKLNDEMIQKITSIDGAVLLDRSANCYAIGVILDGLATEKGDPSRGARYNSAIRYYEQFGGSGGLMLIIISEDGMINLVPDLRGQIKHSQIEDAIATFKKVLEDNELDYKKFNMGMSFFINLNFYLTEAECDEINRLRKEIEEKFSADLAMMRIVYDDLKPHPEMNDSYYK